MPKKLIVTVILFNTFLIYGNISKEANIILNDIINKYNGFYSSNDIPNIEIVKNIIKSKELNALKDEEKIYLTLEVLVLWANLAMMEDEIIGEENYKTLLNKYKEIKKEIKNGHSETYSAFSDFAFTMIPLSRLYGKNNEIMFTLDFSEYSREAIRKDKENEKAKILYGMFWSFPSAYHENTYFSVAKKFLSANENVPLYMKYKAHIYLSILYMKANETEKSFEELNKAENIFPNGFLTLYVRQNYENGNKSPF